MYVSAIRRCGLRGLHTEVLIRSTAFGVDTRPCATGYLRHAMGGAGWHGSYDANGRSAMAHIQ